MEVEFLVKIHQIAMKKNMTSVMIPINPQNLALEVALEAEVTNVLFGVFTVVIFVWLFE